jgi:hypothetical protein
LFLDQWGAVFTSHFEIKSLRDRSSAIAYNSIVHKTAFIKSLSSVTIYFSEEISSETNDKIKPLPLDCKGVAS